MLLDNLQTILSALVPVFALIALGYGCRHFGFPGGVFWPQLERLVYFLFFPVLLVGELATAELQGARIVPVALAVALTLAAMTVLVLALRRSLAVDGPAFTSVFQGAIRFNTYLGLGVAFSLYGREGIAVAAMVIAFLIPLVNVLCVGVLTHYTSARANIRGTLRGIATNPLIIACLVGLGLNSSGLGLPLQSAAIVEILAPAALPLGLMAVGAGLELHTARGRGGVLTIAAVLKLAIMPAVAWAAAAVLGLSALETQILVLFAALPTATSAYILARQMGGDHALIATVLTVQTALSALTLPVVLLLTQAV